MKSYFLTKDGKLGKGNLVNTEEHGFNVIEVVNCGKLGNTPWYEYIYHLVDAYTGEVVCSSKSNIRRILFNTQEDNKDYFKNLDKIIRACTIEQSANSVFREVLHDHFLKLLRKNLKKEIAERFASRN